MAGRGHLADLVRDVRRRLAHADAHDPLSEEGLRALVLRGVRDLSLECLGAGKIRHAWRFGTERAAADRDGVEAIADPLPRLRGFDGERTVRLAAHRLDRAVEADVPVEPEPLTKAPEIVDVLLSSPLAALFLQRRRKGRIGHEVLGDRELHRAVGHARREHPARNVLALEANRAVALLQYLL